MGVTIIGSGKAIPTHTVTNDDLTTFLDTSDEWIVERTGIKTRRIRDRPCRGGSSQGLGMDGYSRGRLA